MSGQSKIRKQNKTHKQNLTGASVLATGVRQGRKGARRTKKEARRVGWKGDAEVI